MTPPSHGLVLEAPAKLNLSLAILGRRPDGYHELAGVMVLLELADRLVALHGAPGLALEGDAARGVPAERDANLAWRGLSAGMRREPGAICLRLAKGIPAAAGLGGGSSDAAAGWRLGRRLARDPAAKDEGAADPDAARELAVIGADVPFFAAAIPAALVTGIGERVAPLDTPWRARPQAAPTAVLVHPPFSLRTADVFAASRPSDWSSRAPAPTLDPAGNDLLSAATRLRPELDTLRGLVLAAGLDPHMTGSGPTIFALTDDPERAGAAAARLRRGGVATTITRLRGRATSIEPADGNEEVRG
ncbi:MAG TPA: 4-(cytidine 5'-diphospho)-2-C-methyl-D-erythritol kinase [Candidatus Limnocylindria bacterium]|nr:4-(cytidine 5'-diphospho)-2-C-methyl-D-erythritol kinase [Candidatus Limnocylindria bacterium]